MIDHEDKVEFLVPLAIEYTVFRCTFFRLRFRG